MMTGILDRLYSQACKSLPTQSFYVWPVRGPDPNHIL